MATKKKTAKKAVKKTAKKIVKKTTNRSAKKLVPKPAPPKSEKKIPAKKKPPQKKEVIVKPPVSAPTLESVSVVTATISAVFTNTNPGLSELNATLNDITKQLTQTGHISFDNTVSGDIIMIQGKSLGTSDISIDVPASPQKMKFPPGTFNFNFFIL